MMEEPAYYSTLPVGESAVVEVLGEDQLDAIEKIVHKRQPPPTFSHLRDGDVVVEVRATDIVWTDTVMCTGQYQHQPKLPYSPGMTYAGLVVFASPAANVAGIRCGDRVAVAGPDAGPRSLGRYQQWGGCASYAVAPAHCVRAVPPSWSFPEAAAFAYGYDTAYHCLIECGKVKKGETILIHGATGGVGITAVHICVMLGLKVISTTRSESKVAFLKGIGVHEVVVLDEQKGFARQVKQLTGGKGVCVVYDGVGGDHITVESMRALRFGGRLLIVGWAATPNVAKGGGKRAPGTGKPNKIPTNLIMMKSLRVIGCPAMIAIKHDPSLAVRREKDITTWILEGKLPPPTIARAFPLKKMKEAMIAKVKSGSEVGSTVVELPSLGIEYREEAGEVVPAQSKKHSAKL